MPSHVHVIVMPSADYGMRPSFADAHRHRWRIGRRLDDPRAFLDPPKKS
jgi:hypothetical protein